MARLEELADLKRMSLPKTTRPAAATSDSPVESHGFEEAFAEHWPRIYRLLARMVGDPAEAEDLALEAFFRLYRRDDPSEADFNTAGWLRRVAVNLGLQSIRSFRRRLTHESAAGNQSILEAPSQSPAQTMIEHERQERAREILASMRPRQSEILLMRYSGASYKEIAETLHLSPTSIGPLLLRAEREFARRYAAVAREDV